MENNKKENEMKIEFISIDGKNYVSLGLAMKRLNINHVQLMRLLKHINFNVANWTTRINEETFFKEDDFLSIKRSLENIKDIGKFDTVIA